LVRYITISGARIGIIFGLFITRSPMGNYFKLTFLVHFYLLLKKEIYCGIFLVYVR